MLAAEVWKNYFDIVIFSREVADYAVQLSRELRRYTTWFVLGRRRYLLHISLYHIPVLPSDFSDFSDTVGSIAKAHRGGPLRLTGLEPPVIQTDNPAWLRNFIWLWLRRLFHLLIGTTVLRNGGIPITCPRG